MIWSLGNLFDSSTKKVPWKSLIPLKILEQLKNNNIHFKNSLKKKITQESQEGKTLQAVNKDKR